MQVFTIVARNYLALALTLADSVAAFHPESGITIVGADGLDDLDPADRRYPMNTSREVLGDAFDDLAFKYDVTEFCTAVKPFVFQRLLAAADGEAVFDSGLLTGESPAQKVSIPVWRVREISIEAQNRSTAATPVKNYAVIAAPVLIKAQVPPKLDQDKTR